MILPYAIVAVIVSSLILLIPSPKYKGVSPKTEDERRRMIKRLSATIAVLVMMLPVYGGLLIGAPAVFNFFVTSTKPQPTTAARIWLAIRAAFVHDHPWSSVSRSELRLAVIDGRPAYPLSPLTSNMHAPFTRLKVYLAAILALLACLPAAQATSPIILAVDSTGAEPKYTVNNQPMSEAKLARFLVGVVEEFGGVDPLILDPDGATTMGTLEKVLHLLHSSGVKTVYRRTAPDDPLAVFDLNASPPAQGGYLLRKEREADFLSPTGSAKAPAAASPDTGSTSRP